jgi:hypothetical protein
MTSLFEEKGLLAQSQKIEAMAKSIIQKLQSPYGVLTSGLGIEWEEADNYFFGRVARVQDKILYLNKQELVRVPYEHAVRLTPVTLSLGTPAGEVKLTFPYGKIIDWLNPKPKIPTMLDRTNLPLSEIEMKGRITEAIVSNSLSKLGGWLANNDTNARCLRNGIIISYGHLIAGTVPTPVSANIWKVDDIGIQNWRENEGGFTLLYPHLKDCLYTEVIRLLQNARPPALGEHLPDYITRVLETLY